jgi:hypothetical protein
MPYHVYDESGKLVGYLEKDTDGERWLSSLPSDYYTFPVGGQVLDAQQFMLRLNTAPSGQAFFARLQERYGRVPVAINPFKELRDLVFGPNVFFIKLRQFVDLTLLNQLLTVLRRTLPAGASFCLLLEPQLLEEVVLPTPEERVEVFMAAEVAESVDGLHEAVGSVMALGA